MSKLTIRAAIDADLQPFAALMREEDRIEISRAIGMDPLGALQQSKRVSAECWIAFIDGEPIAIWGLMVWGVITGRGSPWAFTTDLVTEHWRGFARASRVEVERMRQRCPNGLRVEVDAEYRTACRWLRWCGFKLHTPKPYGPEGRSFHRATMGVLA